VIDRYLIAEMEPVDLERIGSFDETPSGMTIEIVDPVADYAELMESLFDFDAIRALFASGFRMVFDAMHAVTGPYAREILENRLGRRPRHGHQRRAAGGFRRHHPDPNLVHAAICSTS
jgi:phosphoglucomutase